MTRVLMIGGPVHGWRATLTRGRFGPKVWMADPKLLPDEVQLTCYKLVQVAPTRDGELRIFEPAEEDGPPVVGGRHS